jgi:UDP-glucose 4-epimerase
MRVLITGGAGFVGLNLAEALLADGADVVCFDRAPVPDAFLQHIAGFDGRLTQVLGDISARPDLDRAFATGITHVFHGAAITAGPQRERDAPQTVFDVNLGGTLNALEAARDHGVTRYLQPSSLVVYGESFYDRAEVDERETPPTPIGLYGITKYAAERLALRFADLWSLSVLCPRIGAVFGPWEVDSGARDLLTPFMQITTAAQAGRSVKLPQNALDRQWLYSRDLAQALMHLLKVGKVEWPVINIAGQGDWTSAVQRWCERVASVYPGFDWRDAGAGEVAFHETRVRARQRTTRLDASGFTTRFDPEGAFQDYEDWLRQIGST